MLFKKTPLVTLLSFAQACRFFSHFGVRTLLVLYLVNQLHYEDARAFSLNALFCGLIELGGVLGGYLADRYWGLKRTTLIGGVLLSLGYMGLVSEPLLLFSMGLIVVGGSLFSSNITALVGLSHEQEQGPQAQSFTRFYMWQNLGALSATLLCGVVAVYCGFRGAFIVALLGMVAGNGFLCLCHRRLSVLEEKRSFSWTALLLLTLFFAAVMMGMCVADRLLLILPWMTVGLLFFLGFYLVRKGILTKERVYQLFLHLGGLILFFSVEDQICSSLLLFAERQSDPFLLGWKIPSSMITGLNPVIILIFGGWVARKRVQMGLPFLFVAAAFGLLAFVSFSQLPFSILLVMGCVGIISLAELMLAPSVLAYASEVAPHRHRGLIMSLVSIGFSLAFQLSGMLSKLVCVQPGKSEIDVYWTGFAGISVGMLGCGWIFYALSKKVFLQENKPNSLGE